MHCLLSRSLVFADNGRKEFKNGRTLKDLKHPMSGCEQRNLFVMVLCGQVLVRVRVLAYAMQCNGFY